MAAKSDSLRPAPSQKVLITGARGKFARIVIAELASTHPLVFTDILDSEGMEGDYRRADLTNFSETLAAVQGVDTIVHLAIAPPPNPTPPQVPGEVSDYAQRLVRENPQTTLHVLEAARQAGVRRVVYASSLTVHLGERYKLHYSEEDLPAPNSLYACTKLFGEHLGEVYARTDGLEFLSLRFGQPFPIGHMHDGTWQKSRRARSTYVAIEDVARAVRCAVETPVTSGSYIIVSASDNPRFDLSAARAIGYRPTGYFSEHGLTFHPDGKTPTPDQPVSVED